MAFAGRPWKFNCGQTSRRATAGFLPAVVRCVGLEGDSVPSSGPVPGLRCGRFIPTALPLQTRLARACDGRAAKKTSPRHNRQTRRCLSRGFEIPVIGPGERRVTQLRTAWIRSLHVEQRALRRFLEDSRSPAASTSRNISRRKKTSFAAEVYGSRTARIEC